MTKNASAGTGVFATNVLASVLAKAGTERVERRTGSGMICNVPPQAVARHPYNLLISLGNYWGMV